MALSPPKLAWQLFPEFSLTAACAMWPPSDQRIERIRTSASRTLDWERFLRVVRRHDVWGLVREGLTHAASQLPPELKREIDVQADASRRKALAMAAEAIRLQRLFDEAGLPLLLLKGGSLAMLAYGDLGLRSAKDIDLFVSPEALVAAIELIEGAGYRRFDPPLAIPESKLKLMMQLRGDLGFLHEASGLQVELHWMLFLNPHVMTNTSMTATRMVPIAGKNALRTLDRDDLLTYLCLHGALHVWNRLKWLADINALLAADPDVSATHLYRAASARGAGPAAAQALLLCHTVLDLPLAAGFVRELLQSRRIRWLEATGLSTLTFGSGELDPRDVRFGTTRGTLSTLLLGQSWRYFATELQNTAFNETDVLVLTLPKRLRFLYPILRVPMWLWRHAGQRALR